MFTEPICTKATSQTVRNKQEKLEGKSEAIFDTFALQFFLVISDDLCDVT